MRPTLIQQKRVFGQELSAASRQAQKASRGEPSGTCYWVFLAGLIAALHLHFCGFMRGLGCFAIPICVSLIPWAFVLLFYTLVCVPSPGEWKPWTRLPWIGMIGTSAIMAGLFYLPRLAPDYAFLLALLILSPMTGCGKWKRPPRSAWIGLIVVAALLLGAFLLPWLVTLNTATYLPAN